jgi:hypothetical protein
MVNINPSEPDRPNPYERTLKIHLIRELPASEPSTCWAVCGWMVIVIVAGAVCTALVLLF